MSNNTMSGINIWLLTKQKESPPPRHITLNINFWNNLQQKKKKVHFLDIGVFCDQKWEGLCISIPLTIKKEDIKDLHSKIITSPQILNLIFKDSTKYSSKSDVNQPFIFTLGAKDDSQMLNIQDHISIEKLKNENTLICIHFANKLNPKNIYIRFRVPVQDPKIFYRKVSQQGLQDHITSIECMDLRINDPRYIQSINDYDSQIKKFYKEKFSEKHGLTYFLATLKKIHIISIDSFNRHPICYDDNYKLTPRILESEWKTLRYIEYENQEDLLSHHFRYTEKKTLDSSICFIKYEHKTFGKNIWASIFIIIVLGIISSLLSTYITHVFFKPKPINTIISTEKPSSEGKQNEKSEFN